MEAEELAGFDAADYENGGDGWAGRGDGHKIPEDEAGRGEYRPGASRQGKQGDGRGSDREGAGCRSAL